MQDKKKNPKGNNLKSQCTSKEVNNILESP